MRRINCIEVLALALLCLPICVAAQNERHISDYIDTSIGVRDHRSNNCVVGPRTPYSSISPSPQTPDGNMDGYDPQKPVMGFGQMHVSGTGWGTYGHFLLSPQTGDLKTLLADHLSGHSKDVTKAYYYSTHLDRYDIDVELAPAHHTAMYRFTFNNAKQGHVLLDAAQAIASDIVPFMHGRVRRTVTEVNAAAHTVSMMITYEGGWPSGAVTLYCVAKYMADPVASGTWKGADIFEGQNNVSTVEDPEHVGAFLTFDTERNPSVLMKVSVSFVSSEHAQKLMDSDMDHWSFESVRDNARNQWDERLACISIPSSDEEMKTMFYSSLFRVFTAISDRRFDNPHAPDSDRAYWDDNYAYWDTFRSLYPLLTLIDQPTVSGNLNTVIDIFKRDGEVTDGFIAGRSRRDDQGGNNIDHLIAEACLKDIPGVDWSEAYEIVRHNAEYGRIGYNEKGTSDYRTMNYIPERSMSCSQTLEFAHNDYSAALMARKIGAGADYHKYLKRSRNWRNLWNPDLEDNGYVGFIDARRKDGTFCQFPPSEYGGSWDKPFYEGISWLYSYYVPHDFKTLVKLMGGREKFVERLGYGIRNNLINNTNEPGFLCTFAFHHAGRPDLSSYWAHYLIKKGYDMSGYPENDDTGSMTSWFVFVSLGLFPHAGQDFYYLIAPSVDQAVVRLSSGRTLTIKANASDGYTAVKSCRLNGRLLKNLTVNHKDLMQGGVLEFELEPGAGE